MLNELIEEQTTFANEINKIYLLVDRNKNSFTEDQYVYT